MILRSLLTAGLTASALTAGAFLSLSFSNGQASNSVPAFDVGANGDNVSLAPISLGNPQTAGMLAAFSPVPNSKEDGLGFLSNIFGGADSIATYEKAVVVKSGDTLAKILSRAGASKIEAEKIIKSLSGLFDPRSLKVKQKIFARFSPTFPSENSSNNPGKDVFAGLVIPIDYRNQIEVSINNASTGDEFSAKKVSLELHPENVRAKGKINSSLYLAAANKGVSPPVINELIRIFSWDVDFQRDIWKGDGFEVMYQRFHDDDGNAVYDGTIKYAALTLQGKKKAIYLHKLKDGSTDYFDKNGQSARKALMRTPINGARLSSTFGKRKHPILGYTKMHKGSDFAAPRGTPIYAAGNGTIDKSGRNGAYGNYVRIRHNSEYSTAYAHMKAIKRGMGKGKRVSQGQVIGYVGTTGRSTGPHLHYEILQNGRQVNPLKVKMPSGKKLKGGELARFKTALADINSQWATLESEDDQLAQK